ncbi:MAG TPA: acyltransferase family protein, partial [Candidatus Acidoferrum sp.]|nr:acyltransferase family protein [Candidatus Acidoferrum sp.]
LSVEEQFYVVWPVVVLVVLVLLGRRRRGGLTALLGVVVALTAVSFVIAMQQTSSNAAGAYFSTIDRAWEFGVGAILAVGLARFPTIADRLGSRRDFLTLLGTAGIIGSAALVKSSPGFPAPWAAAPVLATALVIFVGAGSARHDNPKLAWPLTNRVSGYLGEISYSLYLFHWPVIIILGALMPTGSTTYYVAAVGAMLGVSVFSYHFIEQPFRQSFSRDSLRRQRRESRVPVLATVALIVIAFTSYAVKPDPPLPPTITAGALPSAGQAADPDLVVPPAALSAAIAASASATTFPVLNPSLDLVSGSNAADTQIFAGCETATVLIATCSYGDRAVAAAHSKVVLVYGDSITMSWLKTVQAALLPQGWAVFGFSRGQCPAADVSMAPNLAGGVVAAQGCDQHHQALASIVQQLDPSLIIMSSSTNTLIQMKDNATGSAADAEYQQGMVETLKLAAAPGRQIVVLSPPPDTKSLSVCDTAGAAPVSCLTTISASWSSMSAADKAAAETTGAHYVDTRLWTCTTNSYCPAFIGTTPVMYGTTHMTKEYSVSLAPELSAALGPLIAAR